MVVISSLQSKARKKQLSSNNYGNTNSSHGGRGWGRRLKQNRNTVWSSYLWNWDKSAHRSAHICFYHFFTCDYESRTFLSLPGNTKPAPGAWLCPGRLARGHLWTWPRESRGSFNAFSCPHLSSTVGWKGTWGQANTPLCFLINQIKLRGREKDLQSDYGFLSEIFTAPLLSRAQRPSVLW